MVSRTRLVSWFAVVLGVLALASLSEPSIAHTSAPARFNPELVARNYSGANGARPTHALTLEKLDVSVDIVGGVAHAVLLANFGNPTSSALEGDFTLTCRQEPRSPAMGWKWTALWSTACWWASARRL